MNTQVQPSERAGAPRPVRVTQPAVDVFENDEALLLRADLPGVSQRDLQVEIDDGLLSIGGRRWLDPRPAEGAEPSGRFMEYQRRFRVSKDIDATRIAARFEHGVLEVTLPKAEASKPRKIAVKVN